MTFSDSYAYDIQEKDVRTKMAFTLDFVYLKIIFMLRNGFIDLEGEILVN